ncbi:MAG: DUF1203 domain-containing protein [Chloroflexi bacterium AL-W]|nr:DUF1203 domain-containing protein [Chloroflexi bacterium AL-N1]NOK68462.1 DUF1203 domain-containing protein [Chloroflexi bacterium AL-N10]NOK74108.1 DUF1203 domain-containing protein [Chloroflexi bacterium AL-N5]NOK83075.1 DUF1203 domain-containing protein [Chloroflexi bacterium AL-W]NOK90598.1 DUF1203 domain-containing protein [Chloroflexi bacterium AL-N15]
MAVDFRCKALPKTLFQPLLTLNDEELALRQAQWITVDAEPGYPCRVSLTDAKVGERVLALSFVYHDVVSPYRAAGPIFVREYAETVEPDVNEIPTMLRHRLLSVRGYNANGIMIVAQVVQGSDLETVIAGQFDDSVVEYLQFHNAHPGCFNCSVYRC